MIPARIDCDASVLNASVVMREFHVDEVVVTIGREPIPLGVVTAEDIVTRVVALGLDSGVLTVGDLLALLSH
jgi:signal-transduction protein with cAMP-binding, CBS, and nucleotidyltransferase domain